MKAQVRKERGNTGVLGNARTRNDAVIFDWTRWLQPTDSRAASPAKSPAESVPASPAFAISTLLNVCDPPDFNSFDHEVLEYLAGERETSRFQSVRPVAGVPAGWTVESWARRLRQLAHSCEENRPDIAAQHRAEAYRIEEALLE